MPLTLLPLFLINREAVEQRTGEHATFICIIRKDLDCYLLVGSRQHNQCEYRSDLNHPHSSTPAPAACGPVPELASQGSLGIRPRPVGRAAQTLDHILISPPDSAHHPWMRGLDLSVTMSQ